MHMLDLMSSIIMEGDGVTQELLDTILINLIPAHKVGKHLITSQSHFPVQSRMANQCVVVPLSVL